MMASLKVRKFTMVIVALFGFLSAITTAQQTCGCQFRGRRIVPGFEGGPCAALTAGSGISFEGECDGVLLTDSAAVDESNNVAFDEDVLGSPGVHLVDGGYIDIKDEGCLQLNKNDTPFSLSFWINASYVSGTGLIIISTKSPYGGSENGISLTVQFVEGNTKIRIYVKSSGGGGQVGDYRTATSYDGDADVWNFVTLTFEPKGDFADVLVGINLKETKMKHHPNVYNSNWRIGDVGWGSIMPFSLSEFRSYHRVLTTSEKTALYLQHAAPAGRSPTLDTSIITMQEYFDGVHSDTSAFGQAASQFTTDGPFLLSNPSAIERAMDLIDTFEASNLGPLFVTSSTRNGVSRSSSDQVIMGMIGVQQTILDNVYSSQVVQTCGDTLLRNRAWQTRTHFPGDIIHSEPGSDSRIGSGSVDVSIDASVPSAWGRPVAFVTQAMRRPTGYYLPAGKVAYVIVPNAVLNFGGFTILIGAHSSDHSNKGTLRRLDRVTSRYEITQRRTRIMSPLGGGIYIEVPYLADLEEITIQIQGSSVVKAPFFSLKRFHNTTNSEWSDMRQFSTAPWADLETDKFMVQVPTPWIVNLNDPLSLLQDWNKAMDGVSDMLGFPLDKRNRHIMYIQPDLQIKHGAYGIGYPQVNNIYRPPVQNLSNLNSVWYLSDVTKFEVEYHELGHAQLMSMFTGETEAIVNFPHCYVTNVCFGRDLETAFKQSFGPTYGDPGFAPDDAAIHWMITANFRNGNEMDKSNTQDDQFRYQQRGYAKYVDMVRLHGWQMLRDFHHSEHLAYMDGDADERGYRFDKEGLTRNEDRIYRLSLAAGSDLSPLIHFWGIHPSSGLLPEAMLNASLTRSTQLKDFLLRYKSIIPENNEEFNDHFERVYPGRPSGGNPKYGVGWYNQWREVWDETYAQLTKQALDDIIDLYYPDE